MESQLFLWNHHYFHGITTIRQVATIFMELPLFSWNRNYFGRIPTLIVGIQPYGCDRNLKRSQARKEEQHAPDSQAICRSAGILRLST